MKCGHRFSMSASTVAALLTALTCLLASQARASDVKDRVICTTEPPSKWMSEAKARERFHAEKYMLVRFKISSENCHEFYAIEHGGAVVEAYVHPISGEVIRMTRIPLPKQTPPAPPAGH